MLRCSARLMEASYDSNAKTWLSTVADSFSGGVKRPFFLLCFLGYGKTWFWILDIWNIPMHLFATRKNSHLAIHHRRQHHSPGEVADSEQYFWDAGGVQHDPDALQCLCQQSTSTRSVGVAGIKCSEADGAWEHIWTYMNIFIMRCPKKWEFHLYQSSWWFDLLLFWVTTYT